MANKKGRPRNPAGAGTQVRIDADLAAKAKMVATDQGKTLAAYLSELLRPGIDRDFGRIVKRVAEAGEGGGR